MGSASIATALLLVLAMPATARSPTPLTRHAAKIRTFEALLAQTEQPPDSADATHAAITVAGCRRFGAGWLCRGSLSPVLFSGIPASSCSLLVAVYPHATRVTNGACARRLPG